MASAGQVSVEFTAETKRFTDELRKVQTSLGRVENSFKGVDKVAGIALRAFSVEKLAGFAKQALVAADASNDAAEGIRHAERAVKELTSTLTTYTQKFTAGLAIAILGPPNEILKIDEQIEDLQRRRDALLSGGFGRGSASSAGREAALAEAKRIDEQIKALLNQQRDLLNTPEIKLEIDLAPIQALRIETDGARQLAEAAAAAYNNLATSVANAPVERMREISAIVGEGYLDAQREFQSEMSAAFMTELENRNAAVAASAQYQYEVQLQAEEAIRQQKSLTVDYAIGFLQMLGQKNKAFAIAGIVLEKAVSIQRMLLHNQEAAWLAYSAALIPGYPPSIAAAEAIRASVLTQGYATAALMAGMGALQIADVTSGGGRSAIGTPLNPAAVNPVLDQDSRGGATSQSAVQVIIQGNVIGNQQFIDQLIDSIKDEINNRDVIVIRPESRQAQELRG